MILFLNFPPLMWRNEYVTLEPREQEIRLRSILRLLLCEQIKEKQ